MQTTRSNNMSLLQTPSQGRRFQTRKSSALVKRSRGPVRVHAFTNSAEFEIKKSTAAEAHAKAKELLPELQQALSIAQSARDPAAEAERLWQEHYTTVANLQGQAHQSLNELRNGVTTALGGSQQMANEMLCHHVHHRLEAYKSTLPAITHWQPCTPSEQPLSWLPGSTMVTQLVACQSNDLQYVVACISLAATPMDHDALKSVMLHWGCTVDGAHGGWMDILPEGWHTSPSVSQPFGKTAWETSFNTYAPVLGGQVTSSVEVFSVVLQIPLQGPLAVESGSGLKWVLKRTDGGQPEWIKPYHGADFYLDFDPVNQYFEHQRLKTQQAVLAAAHLDIDMAADWGWTSRDDSIIGLDNSSDWDDDNGRSKSFVEEQTSLQARINEYKEPTVDPLPTGWLSSVERWEVLSDYQPLTTQVSQSLSQQLYHLLALLKAAEDNGSTDGTIKELLSRCHEMQGTLQQYDSANLAARAAQHEKENLWESHREASSRASQLQSEIDAALDAATKATVALRGRSTEITVADIQGLCHQLASQNMKKDKSGFWPFGGSAASDRKQVFISQKEMRIAGLDAHVVGQVYLEGPSASVDALMSPSSTNTDSSSEDESSATMKKKPEAPLDTLIISIALGEEFPKGLLTSSLLHFGCAPHHGAKWNMPPKGWSSHPDALPTDPTTTDATSSSTKEQDEDGELPWVALQRFALSGTDGSMVLINPELHGMVIKLPLKECVLGHVRGVEFVLKTRDGRWLSWDRGYGAPTNFYIDLPIPGR